MTAECLKQFTAASTGHYHARRTVLSEISEIRETLAIGFLVGRILFHILTLHVEEEGGTKEDPRLPFLIAKPHEWVEMGSGSGRKVNRRLFG